jgi:DNA-binding transcriptional ArsR family regulator
MTDRDKPTEPVILLSALAHDLRLAILKELAGQAELSPQECAERVGIHLSHVSYHFRILAKSKAIALVRTEPVRGAMKHYYRLAIEEPWALEVLRRDSTSSARQPEGCDG